MVWIGYEVKLGPLAPLTFSDGVYRVRGEARLAGSQLVDGHHSERVHAEGDESGDGGGGGGAAGRPEPLLQRRPVALLTLPAGQST